MLPEHTHATRRYLLWLILLLVIVGVAFVLRNMFFSSNSDSSTLASVSVVVPNHAPMPSDADYVTAQKGFQYLIVYNGRDFLPNTLDILSGETVRFTNNSKSALVLTIGKDAPSTVLPGGYIERVFSQPSKTSYNDGTVIGTIITR